MLRELGKCIAAYLERFGDSETQQEDRTERIVCGSEVPSWASCCSECGAEVEGSC